MRPRSLADVRAVCIAGPRPNTIAVTQRHAERERQHGRVDRDLREPRQILRRHDDERAHAGDRRTPARRCRRAPRSSAFRSAAGARCATRSAPSAYRIEISACRVAAWPSSRCATFAHAISSSTATAICSSTTSGRTSPTISSCSGTHVRAEAGVGRRISLRQRRHHARQLRLRLLARRARAPAGRPRR